MVYNVFVCPIEVLFEFLLYEYKPFWATPRVTFLIISKDKIVYVKKTFLTRCNIHRTTDFYIRGCVHRNSVLTFRRRIKSRLPFAGIIRRLSYSTGFQDKG